MHWPRGLHDHLDVGQDQCMVERGVEDRTDGVHALDKGCMDHLHHYNMYHGIAMHWGHHGLHALAADGMEGHEEGFPEGMDDNSEVAYMALAGRVHAVEHTNQPVLYFVRLPPWLTSGCSR